ncbi:unnamed protein product [Parnassius apollo]|uniref:(apollo) hypothetical protein n=1 Tax=Parnassius apollo TaxID=110799 RepID=A0A8S3WNA5_PARAO|nr:unnamed protein product [Parnassius apollo]
MRAHSSRPVASTGLVDSTPAGCVYSRTVRSHSPRPVASTRLVDSTPSGCVYILAHCAHIFTEAGGEHGAGGLDECGVRAYSRTMRAHSPTPVASTRLVDSMPAGCVYILAHYARTLTEAGGEHEAGGLDDGGVRV